MIVHILLIIIVFLYAFSSKKEQRVGIVVCGILLFFIFGFKGFDVGTDTPDYIYEYNNASKNFEFDNEEFEPARTMFVGLCRYLGLSARGYLIIVALITCIPLVKFIKRYSITPCFTLLLYITIGNYTFNLTGIRQTIASSVVIAGLYLAFKNKALLKRIIIVLLAVLLAHFMHKSALFCLSLIPLLLIKDVNKKSVLVLSIIPPALLFLKGSVFSLFLNFLVGKYESYGTYESDPNFIAYFVIPYVIYLYSAYLFLLWKKTNCIDKSSLEHRFIVFCYMCSWLYATIAGASLAFTIVARFIYYVNLPTFVLISNLLVITHFGEDSKRLQKIGIAMICILFFLVSTPGGVLGIDNYHFALW